MWNPFKKKKSGGGNAQSNMGFMQRLAMKKLMSMGEDERNQLMQQLLSPENVAKNKDKILASIEQMKASGMITESQAEEARKKFRI